MNTSSWLPLDDLPTVTDALLVGVSGGADSIALAHLFHRTPSPLPKILWVHVHHGLRGKEADEDADFVRRQADVLGVDVRIIQKDVKKASTGSGVSVEMAARQARTEAFQTVAESFASPVIVLAHTLEDQLETMLMKWMRGAAPGALAGMKRLSERNGLKFFRPMLHVHRQSLRDWLLEEGMPWREDSSNEEYRFLRNRVRHEVLPMLKSVFGDDAMNPAAQLATIQAEESELLDQLAKDITGTSDGIELETFRKQPMVLQRRGLISWLQHHGVFDTRAACLEQLLEVAQGRNGSSGVDLREDLRVERQYDRLVLVPSLVTQKPIELPVPSLVEGVIWNGLHFRSSLHTGFTRNSERTPNIPSVGYISAKKLNQQSLTIRSWRDGDTLRPVGMGGCRKKLQDVFTDAKIPTVERHRFPVVCCDEELIWLPGYSVDMDWMVENTEADSIKLECTRPEF